MADFSIRQLPPSSVGFRGLPPTHILPISDDMTGGRGDRGPKFTGHFLSRISEFSAALAGFIPRQIPPASAGLRGLPSPHIFPNADDVTGGREGAHGGQSPGAAIQHKLQFAVLIWMILASAGYRQIPSDFAGFLLHIYCPIQKT